jgi:hypothetical protein
MKKTWISCSRADPIGVSLVDHDVDLTIIICSLSVKIDFYLHALGLLVYCDVAGHEPPSICALYATPFAATNLLLFQSKHMVFDLVLRPTTRK